MASGSSYTRTNSHPIRLQRQYARAKLFWAEPLLKQDWLFFNQTRPAGIGLGEAQVFHKHTHLLSGKPDAYSRPVFVADPLEDGKSLGIAWSVRGSPMD